MKRYTKIFKESIPQENIKRGNVRPQDRRSFDTSGMKSLGLDYDDVIGWFSNKYNQAGGWDILKASDADKREFGKDVFRSYNESKKSTSIIKIDIQKGTYAFIDNEAYLEGDIKFEKMSAYQRLIIDPTDKAFKEFNIV